MRSLTTAVLISFFLITSACDQPKAAVAPPPPPQVNVATVIQKDVPTYGDWVATLQGFQNAQIQPQVSGYLIKQNYREGSTVRKGEVLFEIDPRPFQAALDQATAQLAQAQAQLAQANAALQLTEINVKRDTPLAAAHAIAQSQLDNDVQARAQQTAAVASGKAAIQAAEAAVEKAKLDLGFTQVRSLLDGVAGIASTQIGNLVGPSTVLTTVSQVSPIKAFFSISETEYLQLTGSGRAGQWLEIANRTPLQLTLADNSVFNQPGRILFADRQVNNQTGAILTVASFPNPKGLLRPGQFGRVRARTGVLHDAVLVPQRAVSELQGRHQLAVVNADNKVEIRTVEVGQQLGTLWIISSGVHPGERVVTEGIAKVRDGATVNPQQQPQPEQTQPEGF